MALTACTTEHCIREGGHSGRHVSFTDWVNKNMPRGVRFAAATNPMDYGESRETLTTSEVRERDPNWLAEQNLSADEWKRAYFALADICQPRVERLTDALRQLGVAEAVLSDVADGRTDIDGRLPGGDRGAASVARDLLGRGLPVAWVGLSLRQAAEAALTDFMYEHGSDFTPELWPGMAALREVLGAGDTERAVGTGICCDAPLENGWTCTRLPNHEGVHQ